MTEVGQEEGTLREKGQLQSFRFTEVSKVTAVPLKAVLVNETSAYLSLLQIYLLCETFSPLNNRNRPKSLAVFTYGHY